MKRLFPLLFLFLFSSCFDQNDCITTSTNLVKVDLYTLGAVLQKKTFKMVVRDSTEGRPETFQRLPYFENADVTALQLPLDPKSSQNSFTLLTADSVTYKIRFGYSTYSRVISPDCGAFLYYNDLKVVDTTFPSTSIISHELYTGVTTNVKVFF